MIISNASKTDKSDFFSDRYIQINDCGFQRTNFDITQFRRLGRRDYQIILVAHAPFKVLHNGCFYELDEGSFIIYAPHEEQEYSFKNGTETMWCHFTGSAISEILDEAGLKSGVYTPGHDKRVIESFYTLIRRCSCNASSHDKNAAFLELISALSGSIKEKRNGSRLSVAISFINKNYNKDISLEELSRLTGYSKSRFSHIFSEEYKTTPKEYQNAIRLKISWEMLETTELSIGQISNACGYSDPLYYSRIFKRVYGVSPSGFRKKVTGT